MAGGIECSKDAVRHGCLGLTDYGRVLKGYDELVAAAVKDFCSYRLFLYTREPAGNAFSRFFIHFYRCSG